MGNNQSNTRNRDWKIFRIVDKYRSSDYIRVTFNDEVSYRDGKSKDFYIRNNYWSHVKFSHFLGHPKVIGMLVEIDLERTRSDNMDHYFGSSDDVMRLATPMRIRETLREEYGELTQFLMDTNEYLNEIAKARQDRLAAAEYGRWLGQTQSWTSYNLPPK